MRTHPFENRLLAALVCSLALAMMPHATRGDISMATPSPALSAGEKTFVDGVTRDLQARFRTTEAATKAGYFRYTNEDNTGAISWVNTSYWKSDPQHPAQLWFDVKGRLIGADFSLPKGDSATAPGLWGVSDSRWITIALHAHFGVKTASGVTYGGFGPKSATRIGASLANPTPADVVKLGKAKSVDDVAFTFAYPAIWDLQVWLVPNPLGAFAEHNPNVIPSKSAEKEM